MELDRPLHSSEQAPKNPNGLIAWLKVMDATLKLIEASAWAIRDAAEETASWAKNDWTRLVLGFGDLRARGSESRDKAARLLRAGKKLGLIVASYRLHLTKAAFLSKARASRALERLHADNARRFRELAEEQGGGFLKVGQLLSARRDLLPEVFVAELASLQDQAPKLAPEIARAAIERELSAPLEELFASFEELPCAAASIGQVHRARLLSGREVAVKVRRPGIEHTLSLDLELMSTFLEGLRGALPPTDLETIEREIRRSILEEVDFIREAARTRELGARLPRTQGVSAPEVVGERSGEDVLTTTWVDGSKLTTALDGATPEERTRLFEALIQSLARQILVDGAFHADPHPGNILVGEDGELVFLDFGCVGHVAPHARREYVRLLQAFVASDRETVASALLALGFRTESGKPDTLLVFADAILGLLRSPEELERLKRSSDITEELSRLLAAAANDPVTTLPGEFIMIARVFGTLGGLVMHYEPAIDPARALFPVLMEAMAG